MGKRTRKQKQLIHIQGRRAEAFRQLTQGIPYDKTLIVHTLLSPLSPLLC
jgi:hypothetical protein